mmetsp:Transcript_31963/g.74874  ORF Transcript_31963/g.74874 Transcript_31963/m.74874 type:complete len:239 (+) Transcript_31963:373-1089(+)
MSLAVGDAKVLHHQLSERLRIHHCQLAVLQRYHSTSMLPFDPQGHASYAIILLDVVVDFNGVVTAQVILSISNQDYVHTFSCIAVIEEFMPDCQRLLPDGIIAHATDHHLVHLVQVVEKRPAQENGSMHLTSQSHLYGVWQQCKRCHILLSQNGSANGAITMLSEEGVDACAQLQGDPLLGDVLLHQVLLPCLLSADPSDRIDCVGNAADDRRDHHERTNQDAHVENAFLCISGKDLH